MTSLFQPLSLIFKKRADEPLLQRQGFKSFYDLASVYNARLLEDIDSQDDQLNTAMVPPRPKSRRKMMVDILEIVVYGNRSKGIQDRIIADLRDLMNTRFQCFKCRPIEYPYSEKARGRRFVFYSNSFNLLAGEEKERVSEAVNSVVSLSIEHSTM